jgi:hypothetical protein
VAEVLASTTPLPGLKLGGGLGFDVEKGRFGGALRGRTWLPANDAIPGTVARMQYWGAGLGLSACLIARASVKASLAFCAIGDGAAIVGTSTGGLTAKTVTAPWYAAGGGIRLRHRFSRWFELESRLELVASLTRPHFFLNSGTEAAPVLTEAWRVSRLGMTLTTGFAFDLL